ncbi:MAG: protein-L-isoaspartate(D-aspartate) O-methyltransferase [Enterobacterales bacterium]|nr:protein-L-isoaspartate(D-aspartate) O-methyltransferase [Enterobacterales bacterium]
MLKQNLAGIGMTSQRTRSRLVDRLREKGIKEESVLAAIESIPRHIFIDEAMAHRAYEDTALPIGMGQTISQPYIVARMTELLVDSGIMGNVLEVGTGCGYQSAILAQVSFQVYSIERIEALQNKALERFATLDIKNISCKHADGYLGWPLNAPFDAIIVTASPDQIPQALVDQLATGGRMIIPLTQNNGEQQLILLQKTDQGMQQTDLEQVKFVPLVAGRLS